MLTSYRALLDLEHGHAGVAVQNVEKPGFVALVVAAFVPFGGIGSHFQRKAPERASKARTTPPGMFTRLLSSIADPTITMSSATAGGDVM